MIARLALAAAALSLVFWLGAMERNTRLQSDAQHATLSGHVAVPQSRLRRARFLNLDTEPDFLRAILYYRAGDGRRALVLLNSILAREPDNLPAWALLRAMTRKSDPPTAAHALAEMRRLDPLDVKARRGL